MMVFCTPRAHSSYPFSPTPSPQHLPLPGPRGLHCMSAFCSLPWTGALLWSFHPTTLWPTRWREATPNISLWHGSFKLVTLGSISVLLPDSIWRFSSNKAPRCVLQRVLQPTLPVLSWGGTPHPSILHSGGMSSFVEVKDWI